MIGPRCSSLASRYEHLVLLLSLVVLVWSRTELSTVVVASSTDVGVLDDPRYLWYQEKERELNETYEIWAEEFDKEQDQHDSDLAELKEVFDSIRPHVVSLGESIMTIIKDHAASAQEEIRPFLKFMIATGAALSVAQPYVLAGVAVLAIVSVVLDFALGKQDELPVEQIVDAIRTQSDIQTSNEVIAEIHGEFAALQSWICLLGRIQKCVMADKIRSDDLNIRMLISSCSDILLHNQRFLGKLWQHIIQYAYSCYSTEDSAMAELRGTYMARMMTLYIGLSFWHVIQLKILSHLHKELGSQGLYHLLSESIEDHRLAAKRRMEALGFGAKRRIRTRFLHHLLKEKAFEECQSFYRYCCDDSHFLNQFAGFSSKLLFPRYRNQGRKPPPFVSEGLMLLTGITYRERWKQLVSQPKPYQDVWLFQVVQVVRDDEEYQVHIISVRSGTFLVVTESNKLDLLDKPFSWTLRLRKPMPSMKESLLFVDTQGHRVHITKGTLSYKDKSGHRRFLMSGPYETGGRTFCQIHDGYESREQYFEDAEWLFDT